MSQPFVLVSPKGNIGTGANNSSVVNDGAAYGPDTLQGATSPAQYGPPYSTTSGIQEAINSLGTGGGSVFLLPTALFNIGATINLNSKTVLRSEMFGGEMYTGAGVVVNRPSSYIAFSGSGDAIVIVPNASKSGLIGIALYGSATGALIHRTSCDQSFLVDCYAENTNAAGSGTIIDCPAANGAGAPAEANSASRSYFSGGKRAIGIGTNDLVNHANNCTWIDIVGEVTGTGNNVVDAAAGTNHRFVNFYSRSGTTGAIFSGAASLALHGGELLNSSAGASGSSTSALVANVSGGSWLFRDLSVTAGSITASGGSVRLKNVKFNTPPSGKSVGPITINGPGLTAFIDRECDLSGLSAGNLVVGPASCDLYLDTRTPLWDPATVLTIGSARVHPDNASAPAIPLAVGLPYTNNAKNLQFFMMWGGTGVTFVKVNNSAAGINQTAGPWFFVLRYKDTVTVGAGVLPQAAWYDIT